jgi:hypothetical protein
MMKPGGNGCSDCTNGSRFYVEAAKPKLSDPRFAALANDHDVNPYYIIPSDEVLDKKFRQDRVKAMGESDKVKNALSAEHRQDIQRKLAQKAEAHIEHRGLKRLKADQSSGRGTKFGYWGQHRF